MRWRRASGARGASRRGEVWKSLWRQPHLAVPAALSALWLPLMPVYLAATFYTFAWAEPQQFIVDYSWFHEAALRFFGGEPLYADPEYFYPPPAVLAFWPTTWISALAGYIASGPLIFAGLAACFVWALRLWERETGEAIPRATRVTLLVVGLASGPVFQNLKYAQVNVLVLASALAFLHFVQRGKPGWGMVALAGGFWLKLLPLALAPLGLVRQRLSDAASGETMLPETGVWRQRLRWAAGGVAGFVALPLALLPWVPWRLYQEYALERFPAFAGLTDRGGLSNSIQASVTRLDLPIEVVTQSGMLPATPLATALAGIVGGIVVGGAMLGAWTGRIGIVRSGLIVLAVLPAVVPLGWEHTFVLAVPLLLAVLAESGRQRPLARWLAAGCALAFFAQRPPASMMLALVEVLPRWCIDLYLARLWGAVLVLIGLSVAQARPLAPYTRGAPTPSAMLRVLGFALLFFLAACGSSDEATKEIEGVDPVQTDGDLAPDATLAPEAEQAPLSDITPGPQMQPEATLEPQSE